MHASCTVAKEIGKWTVRVNGRFVDDFSWFEGGEARARRVAMRLDLALNQKDAANAR